MGDASLQHRVGTEASLASDSPDRMYAAIFEDDGQTGYLYGAQYATPGGKDFSILDALHIYNAAQVVDKKAVYPLRIMWWPDRHRVGLFIEGGCHAIFDFDLNRAVCRTGFPPASGKFTNTHSWDESLLPKA
jgi:hypothetical protein